MSTFIIAIIGAVSGMVGAVLGVTNFVRAISKDKVRIKVYPAMYLFIENNSSEKGKSLPVPSVCIEVVNLSDFPITIKDVGFVTDMYAKNAEVSFIDKKIVGGGDLPKRMDSRTSVAIFYPGQTLFTDSFDKLKATYVITQCGEKFVQRIKQPLRTKNQGDVILN